MSILRTETILPLSRSTWKKSLLFHRWKLKGILHSYTFTLSGSTFLVENPMGYIHVLMYVMCLRAFTYLVKTFVCILYQYQQWTPLHNKCKRRSPFSYITNSIKGIIELSFHRSLCGFK